MQTILQEMIQWIVAISIMLLVFAIILKNMNARSFYKRIAAGQLCSFFEGAERNIGRIAEIKGDIIKVEFIDTDNVANIKSLDISDIYPPS